MLITNSKVILNYFKCLESNVLKVSKNTTKNQGNKLNCKYYSKD